MSCLEGPSRQAAQGWEAAALPGPLLVHVPGAQRQHPPLSLNHLEVCSFSRGIKGFCTVLDTNT